jgi:hypothetical protein
LPERPREPLRQWRLSSLLPNTKVISRANLRYSRANLERIIAAPRYNNMGVSRKAVRGMIARD